MIWHVVIGAPNLWSWFIVVCENSNRSVCLWNDKAACVESGVRGLASVDGERSGHSRRGAASGRTRDESLRLMLLLDI